MFDRFEVFEEGNLDVRHGDRSVVQGVEGKPVVITHAEGIRNVSVGKAVVKD
jgi:hypothetical protein